MLCFALQVMTVHVRLCKVCPHALTPQQYQQKVLLLDSIIYPSQGTSEKL